MKLLHVSLLVRATACVGLRKNFWKQAKDRLTADIRTAIILSASCFYLFTNTVCKELYYICFIYNSFVVMFYHQYSVFDINYIISTC